MTVVLSAFFVFAIVALAYTGISCLLIGKSFVVICFRYAKGVNDVLCGRRKQAYEELRKMHLLMNSFGWRHGMGGFTGAAAVVAWAILTILMVTLTIMGFVAVPF